ncbi:unnamed protein product [Haemonchus placei]|uniref:Amino_oxidase domain-containing protein n=1 Tax=Haemonchus placei TaxID=6290 RepID=A0A158QLZ1_HAEPC|nr:unnamed protein product [Haemonchus placei]
MRIVCIGAAPTGLGAAYRLNELIQEKNINASDVEMVIFEKESYAGGLSCTVEDEQGFLWDMGGHITFNHNFPYYEKAVKWAVDEWNSLQRNCMVDMNYLYDKAGIHLVPYPAQFAVPLFPEDVKQSCLRDLKERYDRYGEVSQSRQHQPSVTPDGNKYWSLMCECARPIDDPITEEEVVKQAIDGLVIKSMIQRDKIVSVYSTTLEYGYPIPTPARDPELARAHRELEKHSIYSRGRFGGWKYEVSNQVGCSQQFFTNFRTAPQLFFKSSVTEHKPRNIAH